MFSRHAGGVYDAQGLITLILAQVLALVRLMLSNAAPRWRDATCARSS
jgi:hypothetical protein